VQVSAEGAALVETQTNALFGDVKALTRQMQEAVGNVSSLEEVMQKVQVRKKFLFPRVCEPQTCSRHPVVVRLQYVRAPRAG